MASQQNEDGLQNLERGADSDNRKSAEMEVKELFNEQMKNERYYKAQVDEFVNSAPVDQLVVVLINFSAIGHNDHKGRLIPGEMALAAFNLRSGIVDNCAIYINHGNKISAAALNTLNNLLGLPQSAQNQHTYEDAVWTLNLFRKKFNYGPGKNQHALLFCRKSEYDRVTASLDYIFQEKGGDPYGFQIFPLEYLVGCLSNRVNAKTTPNQPINFLSDSAICELLDNPTYTKLERLACTHHFNKEKVVNYCPLRIINVHAFNIIGHLANSGKTASGYHYPSVSDGDREAYQRQNQLLAWQTNTQRQESVPIKILEERPKVVPRISKADAKAENPEPTSTPPENSTLPCNPPQIASMWNPQFYPQEQPSVSGWNYPYIPFGQSPFRLAYPAQPSAYQWPPLAVYSWNPYQVQSPPHYPHIQNAGQNYNIPPQVGQPQMFLYSGYPNFPFQPQQGQNCFLIPGQETPWRNMDESRDAVPSTSPQPGPSTEITRAPQAASSSAPPILPRKTPSHVNGRPG